MLAIAIVVGSTRPGRNTIKVANWVHDRLKDRDDANVELVDIADFDLPLLDEPVPPSAGKYSKDHTKAWAKTVERFDGYVFVTPEYNHSIPAALKNALDFVYAEWNDKAAAFVSFGSAGGVRSVEHLRGVMAELQIADVRGQVSFSLFDDFEKMSEFAPRDLHKKSLDTMMGQLIGWAGALKSYREAKAKG